MFLNDQQVTLIHDCISVKKIEPGTHQLKILVKDLVELETIIFKCNNLQ